MMEQINRLYRRIISMVAVGKIVFSNDSGVNQIVQVRFNDQQVLDMVRVTEYGFASLPPINSDAVAVFIGGERTNGVVIGTKYKERFANLTQGETALYDNVGQSIHLKQTDGAATGILITGDLIVTGDIYDKNGAKLSLDDLRTAYNTHTHAVSGIQTGSSTVTSATTSNVVE